MSSGSISETLKAKIRTSAGDRCGYCRSLQMYVLGAGGGAIPFFPIHPHFSQAVGAD